MLWYKDNGMRPLVFLRLNIYLGATSSVNWKVINKPSGCWSHWTYKNFSKLASLITGGEFYIIFKRYLIKFKYCWKKPVIKFIQWSTKVLKMVVSKSNRYKFSNLFNPFIHNVEKWPNIHLKSYSVNTAKFLKVYLVIFQHYTWKD